MIHQVYSNKSFKSSKTHKYTNIGDGMACDLC